jgi:SAM-dependent methyltransferase
VDPSNIDTARSWNAATGDRWATHSELFDAAVVGYLPPLLQAAAITPAARILDVGCGAGQTSQAAARLAPAGTVLGVDLSARMLETARRRASEEGLSNIRFQQADAQVADLGVACFDRIISRNGVMFFGDPVVAFSNLAHALTPAGRMVLSLWQPPAQNEWFTAFLGALAAGGKRPPSPPSDQPGPFSLGHPERVCRALTGAGFSDPEIVEVRQPMSFGTDIATAEGLAGGMFADLFAAQLAELDGPAQDRATATLRTSLHAHLGPNGVSYPSAMWIITATLP